MSKKIIQLLFFVLIVAGCKTGHNNIEEIHLDKYNNNFLKIVVQVKTHNKATTSIRYWPASLGELHSFFSAKSNNTNLHKHILLNLLPDTKYNYRVYSSSDFGEDSTKIYEFTSPKLPVWLQNQFATLKDSTSNLPEAFQKGFMLLNKREIPGCIYIVDHKGRIRWYHMVDGQGVKVTHLTKDKTVLSILGTNEDQTSYGREILELNLLGDTVNYLRKNSADLNVQIHHEILKDKNGNYVTLFVDKRIMNLKKYGGLVNDTVVGDGILIINPKGKKVYSWSVFDVLDPLSDKNIIKNKNDWMHANSVNFDLDGNFLMSFYNNGQIWKIDAKNGKVLWKFGKGGDIQMPRGCSFSQAHAVHMTKAGVMMFFNNGVDKKISEGYGIVIDEKSRTSKMVLHIQLPPDIYNDRMGSMYQINDSLFLSCSSKRKIAALLNKKGTIFWDMETAVPSYRIEFIEDLQPYLQPLP